MSNHAAIGGSRRLGEIRIGFNGLGSTGGHSCEAVGGRRIILTQGVEFLPG